MPAWMALFIISLISIFTGWLIIRPFVASRPFTEDWLALLMVCATIGVIFIGLIALLLVEFGVYSLFSLSIMWLFFMMLLMAIAWRKQSPWQPNIVFSPSATHAFFIEQRWEKFALLLWFVAAVWLFFRPHQFIHGGADAGVYVNLAAQIDRIGSIVYEDETFAQLDPAVKTIFARPISNPVADSYLLPAFFLTDAATGEIQPQFYPFHPVWQAIAYGLGGVSAALLINGFWALLSCLAIYLFVRQLWGWETAVLAIVALSLSAMQVWFARYPTTEVQTQFFLWVGFWATSVWLKERQPTSMWAFLAGSSFGVVFLVRIDVIFMLPILLFFITWFWVTKQKGTGWFALPFLTLVIHAFAHALTQSQPYFFELYNFGVRSMLKNQGVLVVVTLFGIVGLLILARYHLQIHAFVERIRTPLLSFIILLLLLFALYNWFIRPYTVDLRIWNDQFSTNAIANYDHENLLRLGWYLSPVGILLGFLGICLLVWRVKKETAVMLAVTLFFTLFYLWNIRNNPHQIYAMRRYVPAVLPLFIVASTHLCYTLWQQHQRWIRAITLVLIMGWLFGIIWSARGFVTQVDWAGNPAQLSQLNSYFEPNAIIIFQDDTPVGVGDFVGTPLRYIYHHDVYKIHAPSESIPPQLVDTIKSWQNNGRKIYWVGNTDWLITNNISHQELMNEMISNQVLEGVYDHKPTEILNVNWQIQLSFLE